MSTKRLSKTVIEGGRAGWNKYERRYSHAETRAEERDYLKQVMVDVEAADEVDIEPTRPIRKEFTDKLAPMERWLKTQVGRPWDEVRSEIFTKFDTRTTAGRHITFDHLLREVVETESGFDKHGNMADPNIDIIPNNGRGYGRWGYTNYYVDRSGVLREASKRVYRPSYAKVYEQEYRDAAAWLAGRIIGEKEGKLHWFVPTEGIWDASWLGLNGYGYNTHSDYGITLSYYTIQIGNHKTTIRIPSSYCPGGFYRQEIATSGPHWEEVKNPSSYRRRGELSQSELKHFKTLKAKLRDDILVFGKGR